VKTFGSKGLPEA